MIAAKDPALFNEILTLAKSSYAVNRASYHVSGHIECIPDVSAADYTLQLDQFDAREVLHVAFGSVLAYHYERGVNALNTHIDAYWHTIHGHFNRHIQPFKGF